MSVGPLDLQSKLVSCVRISICVPLMFGEFEMTLKNNLFLQISPLRVISVLRKIIIMFTVCMWD